MNTIFPNKWSNGEKSLLLLTLFIFFTQILLSNALPVQLGFVYKPETFLSFIHDGFFQMASPSLPYVFFLTGFFLLSPTAENTLNQAAVFSIPMILSTWLTLHQVIEPSSYVINSMVLISLLFIGIENLFAFKLKINSTRYFLLFVFGLAIGASLATNLLNTTSTNNPVRTAIPYSIGLLLGEACVLALLFLLVGKFLAGKSYYKAWVLKPVSALFAIGSLYSLYMLLMANN